MWGWVVSGDFRGLNDLFNMFNDLAPIMSPILSIVALCLVVIVSFLNLYSRFRRKFPTSVNCWFCNSNVNVPYTNKNSFDCPVCLQYNGFTKEGDYNKIIPEQHDEFMNASLDTTTKSKNARNHLTNGLCTLCNNNQQLKIHQLANFVPMHEENYDAEIEHFQEQLEKAYKLCKKCDRVLKKEIDKQSAWIFGESIRNSRYSTGNKTPDGGKRFRKPPVLTLLNLTSFGLALAVYSVGVLPCLFSTKMLSHIPREYAQFLTNISVPYFESIDRKSILWTAFLYRNDLLPSITIAGLLVQLVSVKWNSTFANLNCVLSWLIILVTCYVNSRKYFTVIVIVQMFCCGYLMSAVFSKTEKPKTPKKTKKTKSMIKIVKNLENTCSDDYSDMDDFDDSNTLSNSSRKSASGGAWTSSPKDHHHHHHHQMNTSSVFNDTFATANDYYNNTTLDTTSSTRHAMHENNFNNSIDVNLKRSLGNLNLGSRMSQQQQQQQQTSSSFGGGDDKLKRPRPLLSPSKFSDSFGGRSSWVAGGYWKSPDGPGVPPLQRTTSRSSSESSGFGSQRNDFTFGNANNIVNRFSPPMREFDCASVISNSQFNNCHTHQFPSVYHTRAPSSIRGEHYVYPNSLFVHRTTAIPSPNHMLYVRRDSLGCFNPLSSPRSPAYAESYRSAFQNWSDVISAKPTQSFKDLSLQFGNYGQKK